jgi:uncharacterized protein (DUF1697 family)
MTRYAAFLRGVNLGKRTVKSAELKAAFEAMGFADVKTLLASGNVLFDARASKSLQQKIETGLHEAFGFRIGVVLRTLDELRTMVAADPYGGVTESEAAKLHVLLFAEPLGANAKIVGVKGDFDVPTITEREVHLIAYRKPDGTYLASSLLDMDRRITKGQLVTARNWNTILKAIA